MTSHPPNALCCDAFRARFDRGVYRQDPRTGLVMDRAGGQVLAACPHCGATIDPLVPCGYPGCSAMEPTSEAWVDNGRYLCRVHGPAVHAERELGRAERWMEEP